LKNIILFELEPRSIEIKILELREYLSVGGIKYNEYTHDSASVSVPSHLVAYSGDRTFIPVRSLKVKIMCLAIMYLAIGVKQIGCMLYAAVGLHPCI
jgi:hypothetical protein